MLEFPGPVVLSREAWGAVAGDLHLSERELEITQCIFCDLKESDIARRLSMSPHTVHTHLGRLYRKLCTNSRCGVVLRVLRCHLAHLHV